MKRFVLPVLVVAVLVPVSLGAGAGRPDEFVKDPRAVEAYKGEHDTFTLHLIPGRWTRKETPSSPDVEVQFSHQDGNAFAMVVAERLELPVETLKKVAVGRVQRLDEAFKIVEEGKRIVNGRPVLFVILEANIKGIPLTYFTYCCTAPKRSIQIITFTSQSLFKNYKQDMEAFLNGFELTPEPD